MLTMMKLPGYAAGVSFSKYKESFTMYKKILLLCLCLFLAACSNAPDPASSLLLDPQFDTEEFLPDYDFRNGVKKESRACESEDAYYLLSDNNLYLHYLDKDTGTSGVLCGKPECSHSSIECNAYLAGGGNLMFYDGYVYWVQQGTLLYRMRPDGTERELVQSLRGGISNSVWLHRGYVYAVQAVSRVVEGENQSLIRLTQAILGDTEQEPKQILEVPGVDYFYQAAGNTVYLGVEGTIDSGDLTLYAYDSASGDLQTLAQTTLENEGDTRDMRYIEDSIYFSIYYDDKSIIYRYAGTLEPWQEIHPDQPSLTFFLGDSYFFGIIGRDDVVFTLYDFEGNPLQNGQLISDPSLSREVWGFRPQLLSSDSVLVLLVGIGPGYPDLLYEIPLDPAQSPHLLLEFEENLRS